MSINIHQYILVYRGNEGVDSLTGKKSGRLIHLGEPLDSDLIDFCAAHYDASATSVIRTALQQFIENRLTNEPEMRRRFESARKARLKEGSNVRLINNGD